MGALRVLMIAPFERGLEHGGSQRATAIAERLEERGAEVGWRRVSSRRTPRRAKVGAALRLEPALVSLQPKPEPAPGSGTERFDAAIAAHSYLAPQLRAIPRPTPRVVDFHNLEWRHLQDSAVGEAVPRRAYTIGQAALMRRFERRVLADADLSVLVSEEELEWARSAEPEARLEALPSLLPRAQERAAAALGDGGERPRDGSLLYVGTLDFPPNVQALLRFLRAVWPTVRAGSPAARLVVAGRCSAEHQRQIGSFDGVEARGFVPDLKPLLTESAAVLMPVEGRAGTSLRGLLYALAGVWAIGSPAAFRGLPFDIGATAATAEEWAAAVRAALVDDPARAARVQRAREAALELHADPAPWDRFHALLGELAAR